jgi:hypothetical protein
MDRSGGILSRNTTSQNHYLLLETAVKESEGSPYQFKTPNPYTEKGKNGGYDD